MGTVLDYLEKYGKYTFEEMPMTEVDSLALCQLSYLKFDGMVPDVREEGEDIILESLENHPDFEKLFADVRYEKVNRALLMAMLRGRRFSSLRLNYYINVIEQESETQFSAVTYFFQDGMAYVAYRGTDETIVGWKEDFNMAFLSPLPGQEYSVKYLETVAGRFQGSFYVGGHSKGGNLAIYSAMNCLPEIQDRILRIYSMDGPGFRPDVLKKCNYEKIVDRVVKILPNSSTIGMIFESDMHFQVVKSKAIGLLQHDPYTWQVTGNHLVRAKDLYEYSRQMDNALNEWILSLDEQQRRIFVDTLYHVITASQADNLIEFTAEWKRSMNGMIAALKDVDAETAAEMKEMVKSLFNIARVNLGKGNPARNHKKKQTISGQKIIGQKPEKKNNLKSFPH